MVVLFSYKIHHRYINFFREVAQTKDKVAQSHPRIQGRTGQGDKQAQVIFHASMTQEAWTKQHEKNHLHLVQPWLHSS
jgi:hypothetical protein